MIPPDKGGWGVVFLAPHPSLLPLGEKEFLALKAFYVSLSIKRVKLEFLSLFQ